MTTTNLRQAPLRDREEDSDLFVRPDGYEAALWTAEHGFNALILAARGQGKTSVLHQLERALRKDPSTRSVVFVDLAVADSADVALQILLAAASRAGREPLSWVPGVPLPSETPEESRTRAWLDQLAEAHSCAFLIDNLRPQQVGHPLFGIFRDRLWEMPHQWIVAADRLAGKRWLLRPPADSFWEEIVELDYSDDSARELIARRLGGQPSWLAPLVENVGTNPRRLVRAAVDAIRSEDQPGDALREWEDWHRRLAQLDHRSSMLMAELSARPPVSASDPELLGSLGWARTSLIRTLEELEHNGLVESWSEPDGTGRPKRLFTTTEPGRPRRG